MLQDMLYPALIIEHNDGEKHSIYFPDFPITLVHGNSLEEVFAHAETYISTVVYDQFVETGILPTPSKLDGLTGNSRGISLINRINIKTTIKTYVRTNFKLSELKEKTVTVNCTMSASLKRVAVEKGLNFSKILQRGVKEALSLHD
jgi:predicted RNase H-like HicB family nuclease